MDRILNDGGDGGYIYAGEVMVVEVLKRWNCNFGEMMMVPVMVWKLW